ncbi:alpha/beta hydrolase-fold protein [Saccharibacillus sp. CPCC 101409]|uniref:alpha/beta hydrolase n=1 Tax=Saccharibacillus sp. CPCC 101409 TaxID=3058041 RepID=UPI002671DC03|nr:alpha/beta hydrolase-fold protein [Saccharibacillus sp. CPCC 101409]MDO3412001.1 alpha/beta hydrolase-fold protein [Saccharibacillus sp. CPCC 101409]
MNSSHSSHSSEHTEPGRSAKKRPSEISLPGTRRFALHSAEGRQYEILLSLPENDPPPQGYPVIYLLDGHALFATVFEAERAQSRRAEKTGVASSVIVGIGYPSGLPFSPERHFDYTLPVPVENLPASRDGQPWPEHGGADLFLEFIETVLKPRIESELPIDRGRQTLMGHSFGGLFTLHTLFTRPGAFRTYIAGSPSLHWAHPQIGLEEEAFGAALQARSRTLNLLIALGELEDDSRFRMVNNGRMLAERLEKLRDCGLNVQFRLFEGENHGSTLPSLVSPALRMAVL